MNNDQKLIDSNTQFIRLFQTELSKWEHDMSSTNSARKANALISVQVIREFIENMFPQAIQKLYDIVRGQQNLDKNLEKDVSEPKE